LELLAQLGQASQGELAEGLATSRASTFRVIQVLKKRGYIEHNERDHQYYLGPALSDLTSRSSIGLLRQLAGPAMARLRDETTETVNLAVARGGRITYELIFETDRSVRFSAREGDQLPAHASALGKAILASISTAQRDMLLGDEPYRRFTPNTIVSRSALESDLLETQSRGFAMDNEEVEIGAVCLAAPLSGRKDDPVGAISVSCVAARVSPIDRQKIGQQLRRVTESISRSLRDLPVEARE
jgi:IclR family acetate operon transcriptional repressor